MNLGLNEDPLDLGLNDAPETPAFSQKFYKGKEEYAAPFYTINIAHVEGLPEYEVIGVNGEVLQINRGEDVANIPQAFLDVLKNAVASRQVKKIRKDGTEYFDWQPFPAIPYQIVEGPYQTRK